MFVTFAIGIVLRLTAFQSAALQSMYVRGLVLHVAHLVHNHIISERYEFMPFRPSWLCSDEWGGVRREAWRVARRGVEVVPSAISYRVRCTALSFLKRIIVRRQLDGVTAH